MSIVQCNRCETVIPEGTGYLAVEIHRESMRKNYITVTNADAAYILCKDCFMRGCDVEVVPVDQPGEFRKLNGRDPCGWRR